MAFSIALMMEMFDGVVDECSLADLDEDGVINFKAMAIKRRGEGL